MTRKFLLAMLFAVCSMPVWSAYYQCSAGGTIGVTDLRSWADASYKGWQTPTVNGQAIALNAYTQVTDPNNGAVYCQEKGKWYEKGNGFGGGCTAGYTPATAPAGFYCWGTSDSSWGGWTATYSCSNCTIDPGFEQQASVSWTPTVMMGTTSDTISSNTSTFQIVGNEVLATADFVISTISGSGSFLLESLPVPPLNSSCGAGGEGYTDTFIGVAAVCGGSTPSAYLSSGTSEWATAANFTNGTHVHMALRYAFQ